MRLDIPILLATAVSVSALTNPHQRAAEAGFGRFGRPSGHLGGHDHDVEKVHVSERERVGRIGTPASSSSSTATSTSSGGGSGGYRFLNEKTRRFAVNGTSLPEVDFDIGESYAGNLPNTPSGNSSLFFWFFPSTNPAASEEIIIWLNGGPGCSSLDGLLQENGPFLWQPGTYSPIRNPYSWTNLTNMVYVDQPAGTGFSPGPSTVQNEQDVAAQFKDFWKRFVDTFGLHGRKVYITGESYAGQYIPYIAEGMLEEDEKGYFNVAGVQINDPSINGDFVMTEAPSIMALNHFQSIFSLNETFMQEINLQAEKCNYTTFMEEALTYPPKGPIYPPESSLDSEECDIWSSILSAAYYVNPCFNIYHLTDFCPYLWNTMGFPSLAGGPNNYFNRTDVKLAIHAPMDIDYSVCGESPIFDSENGDPSPPSALGPLPRVIEKTNNTIIGHGWLDFLLFANGTLATIQNMTWNGLQGFQFPPVEPLFVPYHDGLGELASTGGEGVGIPFTQVAGGGYLGTAHTERGLTFTSVFLAGHEIPQYTPGAAYRQLEFLLGRIGNLSEVGPYTTSTSSRG